MNEKKIEDIFKSLAENTRMLNESLNKKSDVVLLLRITLDLVKLRFLLGSKTTEQ